MSHGHHGHGEAAAAPTPQYDPAHPDQFPGSTFAANVPDGAPCDIAGRTTYPDSRGGCRYACLENYLNDRAIFPNGPPADACHKYLTWGTIAAFGATPGGEVYNSISYNTGAARLMAGIGYGANVVEPQICHVLGSPHNALLMADTFALAGPGEDGSPAVEMDDALIAYWKQHSPPGKPYYPRAQFFVATDPPKPLGT